MEVINPNLIPISAFETWQLLREIKATQEKSLEEEIEILKKQQEGNERGLQQETLALQQQLIPENLNEMIENSLNYFESEPAPPQSKLSAESISNLCQALRNQFGQVSGNPNGITKAERLQICDLAPTELVELYLIIEECDSRFTEAEIESILNLVKQNLSDNPRLGSKNDDQNDAGTNNATQKHTEYDQQEYMEEDNNFDMGDMDDDDALVAEAREGGPAPDQELDEVPD